MLHFIFPVAGEFRAGERFDVHGLQHLDQVECLCGRDHVLAVANHVLVADELFDNGGARCRRSKSAFLHGVAEFFVFHQLTGAFHHRKQRAFSVVCGRLGKVFLFFEGDRLGRLALECRDVRFFVAVLAVHGLEARINQHLAFGEEGFAFDGRYAGGVFVLGGREEYGDESLADHRENLLFGFGESRGHHAGRDDGEVVRNFGVVEHLGRLHDPVVLEGGLGELGERAFDLSKRRLHGGHVVFRQAAAVGTRVGGCLVAFVQSLRNRKGGLRTKAETVVRFALQCGQVVQRTALLERGGGRFFDGTGLALAFGENFFYAVFVKNLLDFVLAVFLVGGEPLALVVATVVVELGFHGPELLWHELHAFFFAVHNDGKRRGLHASARGHLESAHAAVVGGKATASVHANEPVGFATAKGGCLQVFHFGAVAHVFESFLDGGRGHALHPQALDRLAREFALEHVL